ncbi:ABC transporter substrate-binding protein [Chloroflexota bacterium]
MKKLLLVILVVCWLLPALGCARPSEKVLLIFSYHPEYALVVDETRGVEDVLETRGLQIEKLYLDTKRNTGAEWNKKAAEEAAKKIEEYNPDVVVVFDDNACELVAKKYIGKNLPFVFCGMNANPEDYGFPAKNITGVIERYQIGATIDLLRQLAPGVQELAIITDDSPTSQGFINGMQETILPISVSEVYATNDYGDWKAKIEELQMKVDAIGIFMYHTLKEGDQEQSLPPEDVLRWTLNNNRLPDFAFLDFTISSGVLCGVTVSAYEQGKAAADMVVRILNGEKPVDIAVQCPQTGKAIVNETRAKQLNITIPADVLKEAETVP